MHEQSSEWTDVVKKSSKSQPLTGANLVQLGTRRVLRPSFQNLGAVKQAHQSAFNRIKPALTLAFNPALKGIVGPLLTRPQMGINSSGPFRQTRPNAIPIPAPAY